ncbi:MAG: MarR family transcriptional regulator [Sphingomonas sp.]
MSRAIDRNSEVAAVARGVLRLARRLRAEATDDAPSPAALGLLATLHRQGPMPGVSLAAAEGLKPQSLTRLLARLDTDRLIERTPDPDDRRNLVIAITREGRRALRHAMRERRRWLAEAIDDRLDAGERATLIAAGELMLRLAL